MEENIAILMADLSGYTALTETHGAATAADMIDKYLEIVQSCLVGNCKVVERTGDEIMIVSSSPDFLLATAGMIITKTSGQENFLQVHGGLHYGPVLKRSNSYFGSTVNLTARIAAKAGPGTFWCSKGFVEAVDHKSLFKLRWEGAHAFKNITGMIEVAEVLIDNIKPFSIDPVCRMLIIDKAAAIQHAQNEEIFFCSQHCMDRFNQGQIHYNSIQ